MPATALRLPCYAIVPDGVEVGRKTANAGNGIKTFVKPAIPTTVESRRKTANAGNGIKTGKVVEYRSGPSAK